MSEATRAFIDKLEEGTPAVVPSKVLPVSSRGSRGVRKVQPLKYPQDVTSNELGYVRYDIYPHRQEDDGHQSYTNINLHMPIGVEDSLSAEWAAENDLITTGGAAAKRMIEETKRSRGSETKAGANSEAMSTGLELLDAFGSKAEEILKVPGLDVLTSGTMRRRRRVINPHERHFFKGVGFRAFEFAHKLIPFNEDDAKNIRDICRWFRYYSAPGTAKVTHFDYPAEWHIGFYRGNALNPYLPQIHRCVLTTVSINYTGSSTWSMHRDGAPTDVELNLSFVETVLPTRDVIEQEISPSGLPQSPEQRNKFIEDVSAEANLELVETFGDVKQLYGKAKAMGKNGNAYGKETTKESDRYFKQFDVDYGTSKPNKMDNQ